MIGSHRLQACCLALIFVLSFAGCGGPKIESSDPKSLIGKPMPAFRMFDIADKAITNDDLKGKIVVIDFWATWCPPCRAASPILEQIQSKYQSNGLVVLGANISEGDQPGHREMSKERVTEYSAHRSETYTLTCGNDGLAVACKVNGIPQFMLLDRKGIVRAVLVGAGPDLFEVLDAEIKTILKEG